MGLIREALRVPRLDGDEAGAEATAVRLIDGVEIGVAVPYEMITRLVFGSRPLTGPPRGVRFDEKRGWLELRPPACAAEDEGVFPLTAIVAILPLYIEHAEAAEHAEAGGADRLADEYEGAEASSPNGDHAGEDRDGRLG